MAKRKGGSGEGSIYRLNATLAESIGPSRQVEAVGRARIRFGSQALLGLKLYFRRRSHLP